MEIMEEMNEKEKKTAVDDSEPWDDIVDQMYKEWLEEGQHK